MKTVRPVRLRVYQVGRAYGTSSRSVVDLLQDLGFRVNSHLNCIGVVALAAVDLIHMLSSELTTQRPDDEECA